MPQSLGCHSATLLLWGISADAWRKLAHPLQVFGIPVFWYKKKRMRTEETA